MSGCRGFRVVKLDPELEAILAKGASGMTAEERQRRAELVAALERLVRDEPLRIIPQARKGV